MTCDGAAGGGLVTATVNGQFEVVRVKIDKTVVDPNDVGMLEDLVTAAVNAAAEGPRDEQREDGVGDGRHGRNARHAGAVLSGSKRLAELMSRPGDQIRRPRPKRVRAQTGEILLEVFVTERFVGEVAVSEVSAK